MIGGDGNYQIWKIIPNPFIAVVGDSWFVIDTRNNSLLSALPGDLNPLLTRRLAYALLPQL